MNALRTGSPSKFISSLTLACFIWMNIYPAAAAASDVIDSAQEKAKSGDYSGLKDISKSIQSTSSTKRQSYTPESELSLYGSEEDRSFNDSHEIGTGDLDISTGGSLFQTKLKNNPDTTEGEVYERLRSLYEDSSYHTRDREFKDEGDKLTFNDEKGSELLEEYNRLNDEMEAGTSCRIEVVQPEVTETQIVTTQNTCMYSDAPVYWPSSCRVSRALVLPGVKSGQNMSLPKSVGDSSSSYSRTLSYPSAFTLYKKFKFYIQDVASVSGIVSLPGSLKENHYIMVNGNRVANNGGTITSFLKEGENEMYAACSYGPILNTTDDIKPIGDTSGLDGFEPKLCDSNGDGVNDGVTVMGDLVWGPSGFAKGSYRINNSRNAAGACPSGYYDVGYDDSYDRAGFDNSWSSRRCFKPYTSEQCMAIPSKIRNITADPAKQEFLYWYDKLRAVIPNPGAASANVATELRFPVYSQTLPDSETIPFYTTSRKIYNGGGAYAKFFENGSLIVSGTDGKFYIWFGGDEVAKFNLSDSQACADTGVDGYYTRGPCRVPSLRAALGWFPLWKKYANHQPSYSDGQLSTYSYAMGCGHSAKNITFTFTHPNAIQTVTETPANCVSGNNQYVQALDGSMHYNLKGAAFPYTDSASLPSTNTWRCTDHDDDRSFGAAVSTAATMSYIDGSVSEMFPGDLQGTQVCYSAEAPKYAVDISSVGRCADGTFSCWEADFSFNNFSRQQQHQFVPQELNDSLAEKFIAAINPIKAAHASIFGADTVGEAASVNECATYQSSSTCTKTSEVCAITDAVTGNCRLWDRTYSCEEERDVVVQEQVTQKVCSTPFPCSQGSDEYCSYEDESTDSFQDAALLLTVAQMAGDDANCMSADPSSCVMFEGEAKECRNYVSAGLGEALPTGNCCAKPDGAPGPYAYVQTLYAIAQTEYVRGIATDLATTITSTGVWQDYVVAPAEYVADLVAQAAEEAAEWFSNQAASLGYQQGVDVAAEATAEAASTSLSTSVTASANFLMADISSLMGDILGDWIVDDVLRDEVTGEIVARGQEEMASYIAEQGAQNTVESTAIDAGVSDAVGSVFGTVMAIYAAYKITMLVNQMLIACGSSEFETAYKVGTLSCTKIDQWCSSSNIFGCKERKRKYCCYNSPLARIIHEQASLTGQSNHPVGYDTNEGKQTFDLDCPGFTYQEFSTLDFDKIDLSEWLELLIGAGMLPDGTSDSIDAYTDIGLVTRSLASSDPEFDLSTTTVPDAAERAESLMGAADSSLEEYRFAERELLIMGDQYETLYEFCGYVHGEASSFDGRKGYVIFADGTKNYVSGCTKDPDGGEYAHATSSVGCSEIEVDGVTVQPVTHSFVGKYGEDVIAAECVTY